MSRCCSRQFNSTFVYGALDVDNPNAQPPDSLNRTQYASANLVWMPTERWLFGIEVLWGKRVDKDGADLINPEFALVIGPFSVKEDGRW